MKFVFFFLGAFFLSLVLTRIVKTLAFKFKIVDNPTEPRKIHKAPVPLLGGFAVFFAFWILVFFALFFGFLPGKYVSENFLYGIFIGGFFLMIGGFVDDKLNLKPRFQLIAPILACFSVIGSGIGVEFVTNPFGQAVVHLDSFVYDFNLPFFGAVSFVLIADVFTFVWLSGTMFTTKLLDGLDGLVSGIVTIGSLILFALSLTDKTYQPDVALLAIILGGAFFGFLFWNAHPAKIFLGEGGSVFSGFMLGVLAIISGGKVATALLVMGIPILDVVWVVGRRFFLERKSIASSDGKHLHFRLLTAGLSHRQSVFLLWSLSALFGISSLFLQTQGKIYSLLILGLVMIFLGLWSTQRSKNISSH